MSFETFRNWIARILPQPRPPQIPNPSLAPIAPVDHPQVIAFREMLSACEGTRGPSGYMALFGFKEHLQAPTFDSFDDHPRKSKPFTNTRGEVQYTTAAGRFQFIAPTWDRRARKHGLLRFGPREQDIAATGEIIDAGALDDVIAGRLQAAINKCSPIWASLPASKYPQPKRSYAFARNEFLAAGGRIDE